MVRQTGRLSHTRDTIECVHIKILAKLFFNALGPIRREAVVGLLPHGPITLCRWDITNKGFGSILHKLQITTPFLHRGQEGDSPGVGYVLFTLNTVRWFTIRGCHHHRQSRVCWCGCPYDGYGNSTY